MQIRNFNMKIYFIFFMLFFILFTNNYSKAEDLKSEYDHAFNLGKKGELDKAFKEFSILCDKKNLIPACLNKADYLRYGQGTEKNIEEAIKLYSNIAKEGNEYALLQYASMLEYEYGNNINNVDQIFDIYNNLINSKDNNVRQEAEYGLIRLFSMKLYNDYLNAYYEFYNDKISYEAFEEKLKNIDLTNVIPLIKDKFIAYRESILKEAKHIGRGNNATDHLLWSAKNMAKLFSGDFKPLADIPDAYMNRDKLKKQRREFIDAYAESNLSLPMYDAMLNFAKKK